MWRYGVKKILKFLLSRTFLFGLLIACQVGLFAALMLVFSRAGTVAYIILTPGVPDKWYVYYVTQSYYPRLLEAGVRIYEYTPGFVHAKMYVSDDREAIVGSANMDYRSLYLHFENCCAFYGGHMVRDVLEDVRATLAESHEVTMADVLRTPLYKWLAQVFLRFFSPLM